MAYQAYGNAGKVTAETPREAAQAYFDTFPGSRKCNLIEGTIDGPFFTVVYGRKSEGQWPQAYKDVTNKMVAGLPT